MKSRGRYGQFIRWIFSVVDFLVLNIAYLIVCFASQHDSIGFDRRVWLMLNLSFLAVEYYYSGLHERRVLYADQVMLSVMKVVVLHAVSFFSLIYFFRLPSWPWQALAVLYVLFFIGLSLWWIISRKLLKRYRKAGFNYKQVIVIGAGSVAHRLMAEFNSDSGYGYRVLGVFDNNPASKGVAHYKGNLSKVESFVHDNPVDEMYCTIPSGDSNEVASLIRIADNNAVDFYYVPQLESHITRRFLLFSMGNVPIMAIRPNPLSNPFNAMLKRAFDVLFSSIALILSPIVLIPVAIGIKLSSPGPIFFVQPRTGLRGETFNCFKFRTMRVNGDSDTKQATRNDPRKTKFGDFLRRTSIDELPQFFNVWRGDMSIVGPRPHMLEHTKVYSELIDKYMLRHTIKPGITGWAQVNGYRGQTDELWKMEKRVEYDVWYAENWNFMLDLKIIVLTIFKALHGDNNAF